MATKTAAKLVQQAHYNTIHALFEAADAHVMARKQMGAKYLQELESQGVSVPGSLEAGYLRKLASETHLREPGVMEHLPPKAATLIFISRIPANKSGLKFISDAIKAGDLSASTLQVEAQALLRMYSALGRYDANWAPAEMGLKKAKADQASWQYQFLSSLKSEFKDEFLSNSRLEDVVRQALPMDKAETEVTPEVIKQRLENNVKMEADAVKRAKRIFAKLDERAMA